MPLSTSGTSLGRPVACPAKALCLFLLGALAACSAEPPAEPKPQQAGQPMDPVRVASQMAAVRGAALAGDQKAVEASTNAFTDDFRRSIKLADASRVVDREQARQAVRAVPGVRSVAWVDRENLLILVDSAGARSYKTIDQVCLTLEPLGDTLGVVVNLQNGEARTGDELEILSRNCQLAPGDRALLSRARQIDVIDPEIRRQHAANQAQEELDDEARARQEEAARIVERSMKSVDD